MKWKALNDYLAVSDSSPPYKVCKFLVAGKAHYRASVQGEFICAPVASSKEAHAICERHQQIMYPREVA
ncbi:hypothetical protein QK363_05665 [Pseudomonas aeruginosa]|uniref:hypothetical protein n=1 Tax=Pseudomonas aeruginosa TaxID=287 RepID=UPI00226D805F|nr:hypothetical protein [Pseudomonas aeruginosa]MCY0333169.1 hypothetical protein [Pseudomonas aeruginosa]MCY0351280.1 hypothetical protein [Pseudomonas aeruginosa]MDI3606466.1 hypothetical protein [Pseudomonas aeruginosa]MDI3672862.1 hypothetical protein [Pseudomonas aeruginosa]MDI3703685.1 hypothetical protein [Pseudomonas aeruginosa]